tara:strand:+ start:5134 stop:5727 length:594 start_codon:yes stop_codon:yes gene_type:complete
MIEPIKKINYIKDFIGIFDNYVDEETCDKIISSFELNKKNQAIDRKEADNSTEIVKKDLAIHYFKGHNWIPELDTCETYLREAIKLYDDTTGFTSFINMTELHFSPYKVQRTLPGEGYHVWHIERNYQEICFRALVLTIYLNDVNEGGETEFLLQSQRVKPKKGRILLFPADFPYVHRGNPPLQKDKYILTSWLASK